MSRWQACRQQARWMQWVFLSRINNSQGRWRTFQVWTRMFRLQTYLLHKPPLLPQNCNRHPATFTCTVLGQMQVTTRTLYRATATRVATSVWLGSPKHPRTSVSTTALVSPTTRWWPTVGVPEAFHSSSTLQTKWTSHATEEAKDNSSQRASSKFSNNFSFSSNSNNRRWRIKVATRLQINRDRTQDSETIINPTKMFQNDESSIKCIKIKFKVTL